MAKTVGVVMTEKVVAGLLEDHKVVGELRRFPENSGGGHEAEENGGLIELPADAVAELICEQIAVAGSGRQRSRGGGHRAARHRAQRRDRGFAEPAAAEGREYSGDGQERPGCTRDWITT